MGKKKRSRSSVARDAEKPKQHIPENDTDYDDQPTLEINGNEEEILNEIESGNPAFDIIEKKRGIPKTLDFDANEWLQVNEIADNEYQVGLWWYPNEQLQKKSEWLDSWDTHVPSMKDIATTYGPGKYLLVITAPATRNRKRLFRCYRFNISNHHSRSQMKEQGMQIGQLPQPMYNTPGAQNENMKMMKEIFGMVMPFIAMAQNKDNTGLDMSKVLLNNYANMNAVMKQNLLDNTQFLDDVQRMKGNLSETVETDEEVGAGNMLIETIKPLIKNFAETIISGGSQGRNAVKQVRGLPQFQNIASGKDKKSLVKIVEHLDKTMGVEQTNVVLNQIGVKRPAATVLRKMVKKQKLPNINNIPMVGRRQA